MSKVPLAYSRRPSGRKSVPPRRETPEQKKRRLLAEQEEARKAAAKAAAKAAPKPAAPAPAPKPAAPAPAPAVAAPALPEWNPKMRKSDLLEIASGAGLKLTDDNTKAEIVAALEALG